MSNTLQCALPKNESEVIPHCIQQAVMTCHYLESLHERCYVILACHAAIKVVCEDHLRIDILQMPFVTLFHYLYAPIHIC